MEKNLIFTLHRGMTYYNEIDPHMQNGENILNTAFEKIIQLINPHLQDKYKTDIYSQRGMAKEKIHKRNSLLTWDGK